MSQAVCSSPITAAADISMEISRRKPFRYCTEISRRKPFKYCTENSRRKPFKYGKQQV